MKTNEHTFLNTKPIKKMIIFSVLMFFAQVAFSQNYFDEISVFKPETIYLEEVTEDNNVISIIGDAEHLQDITDFLSVLEQHNYNNLDLKYLKIKGEIYEFIILATG